MEGERAVRVQVRGVVQGVGFRYSTEQVARRLGISGWVRNRPDGSVEVAAQGPSEAVDAMVAFLRRGPRLARVTSAEVTPTDPDPRLTRFDVRF